MKFEITSAPCGSCESCRHWEFCPVYDEMDIGECHKAVFLWDATEWTKVGKRALKKKHHDTHVFVQDASDYSATMYTKRNFFCMDYEEGEYTL